MKQYRFFAIIFIAFFSLYLSVAQNEVSAITSSGSLTQNIGNCQPLDIIFLIDQSDSMETTDPQHRRINAVNNIIRLLLEHAALRCVGVQHRIGVINFGSSIDPVEFDGQPLQAIQFTGDTVGLKERIDSAFINITRNISASEPLGQTRPWLAIEAGVQILNDAPAVNDDGYNQRRKVLMMLSDGDPCNPTGSTTESGGCGDPTWINHYFAPSAITRSYFPGNPSVHGFDTELGLNQAMQETMPFNVRFDVLLFNSGSVRPQTIDGWQQLTTQYGGTLVKPDDIANTSLITARLSGLVNDLLFIEAQEVVCNSSFIVQPYTSSTLILSNVGENRGQIIIYDANDVLVQRIDGITFSQSRLNYVDLGSVERFLIINPAPGAWRIEGSESACANTELTFETIQPIAQWETTPSEVEIERSDPYFVESPDHYLEFKLLDSFSQPFQSIVGYPLSVSVGISGPQGTEGILNGLKLTFEEQSINNRPGIWRSTTPLPAPMKGTYTLSIVGTAPQIDAPNVELFRLNTSYATKPPITVTMDVVAPQEGATLPLNELISGQAVNLPFTISARFIDANGVPVSASRLFDRVENPLVATLTFPSPSTPSEDIYLLPSETDNTLLVGSFRQNATDATTPVDDEGEYQVKVSLNPDVLNTYNNENYTIDVATALEIVRFQRRRLTGVKLVALSPTAESDDIPLNSIDNTTQTSQFIGVRMRVHLVDQDNNAIDPRELFTASDNAIFVQLRRGAELITERTAMTLDGNEYVIHIRQGEADPSGDYLAIFTIGDGVIAPSYDTDRFAFIDGNLTTEVLFNRYELKGVLLKDASFNQLSDNSLPLNEVDPRKPIPVEVKARLEDLNGIAYTDATTIFTNATDLNDLVVAQLYGPDNALLEEKTMTWDAEIGLFVATLRENIDGTIDKAGDYKVRFLLKPATLNTEYQLVQSQTADTSFKRTEQVGLNLVWVSPIAGQVLPLNSIIDNTIIATPFDVQIRVVDETQTPVNLNDAISTTDEKGIIANVRLLSPNGDPFIIPLTIAQGDPTLLIGTRNVPQNLSDMDMPGTYTVYVDILPTSVGTVQQIRRYEWVTLNPQPIDIERKEFYGLQIESTTSATLPLNSVSISGSQTEPIRVSARIVAQEGRTLPPSGVVDDFASAMTVSLQDSQGVIIKENLPMTYVIERDEFEGEIVQPADSPFLAGQYSLIFQLNPSAIKAQDNFQITLPTVTQSVNLSDIVGMTLCIIRPTSGEILPLNTVSNDSTSSAPVSVQVGVCGLDNNIIPLSNVFELPADQPEKFPIVSVQLIDLQTNIPLETGANLLVNADNTLFEGQIRPLHTDQNGQYRLVADLIGNATFKTVDFRQYNLVTSNDIVDFTRETKYGIRLVEVNPQTVYSLNDIQDGEQTPLQVSLAVRLESVADGIPFNDPTIFLANPDDRDNMIFAVISTADRSTEFRQAMVFDNGVYRTNLGSIDKLDPAGVYDVRFEWNRAVIDTTKPYQVVDEPASRQMERREIVGIRLVITQQQGNEPIHAPIYTTWFDALLGSSKPIELTLELQNTNGNRIQPNLVLGEDVFAGILSQTIGFDEGIEKEGVPVELTLNVDGTITAIIPNSTGADYQAQLKMGILAVLPEGYSNLSQSLMLIPITRTIVFNPWVVRIITLIILVMVLSYIINLIRINFFAKTMYGMATFRYVRGTNQGQAPSFSISLKPAFLRFGFRATAQTSTYVNIQDQAGKPKRTKVVVKIIPDNSKTSGNVHTYNIILTQDDSRLDKLLRFDRNNANQEVRFPNTDWHIKLSGN